MGTFIPVGMAESHSARVVGKTFVDLAVAFEDLAVAACEGADDMLVPTLRGDIFSVEREETLARAHALAVGHAEGRFPHRQVVEGVDEVGLAGTVVAHKAVDALAGRNLLLGYVLEVYERQFVEIHGC